MAYYRCMVSSGGSGGSSIILTVTCDSAFVGETLYLTKGLTVLSKIVPATGIVEFEFPENGTWILSNSLTSDTETFENVGEYETNLYSVPDGKTVLPTDDIQIWLSCAGIRDKNYTTLAEVLADTTTLLALINSPNAVDYMVRSTTWAKGASVPVMTSNTTPSGVCSASSVYSGYPAWYAFDDNFSYYWNSADAGTSDYIQYEFPQKVRVDRFKIIIENNSAAGFHNITLSCGDTESDLVNHGNFTLEASTDLQTFEINADLNAKIFRLTSQAESGRYGCVRLLNFYSIGITDNSTAMSLIGANDYAADTLLADETWNEAIQNSEYFESVDNAKVPVMTSNTTPSGECVANAVYGAHTPAWKAFDGDDSTYWIPTVSTSPNYIEYDFNSPVKVKKVTMKVTQVINGGGYPDVPSYVQAWNGEEWVSISNTVNVTTSSSNVEYTVNNDNAYSKYRIYFNGAVVYGNNRNFQVNTLQFYGRQPGGVQTLLNAAGITDKDYTTLAELLNDPVSLNTIMQSEDAVDYLVTCKGWIDDIVSNQDAMSYIGLSNYASNVLTSDLAWLTAIANSTYIDSVLNDKTPTMTSNTTPSGECISKSNYSSDYLPFKAFDGQTDPTIPYGHWEGAISGGNYLGYIFDHMTSIKAVKYWSRPSTDGNSNRNIKAFTLQNSSDGTIWNDVGGAKEGAKEHINVFPILENNSGIGYRLNITSNYGGTWIDVFELQFYGRVDV